MTRIQSHTLLHQALAISLLLTPSLTAAPPTIQLRPSSLITSTLGPYNTGRGRTGSPSPSFTSLQLNLCNSGFASCYAQGQSIPEAAQLIYISAPNVVTVNEICNTDVAALQTGLREAWPSDYTYAVFVPAVDGRTDAAYRCKDGSEYGSAVMGRVGGEAWKGVKAYGGEYVVQDGGNEERVFACVAAVGEHFACATHLSSKDKGVAMGQCKALMFDAVPYLKGVAGFEGRVVVGGDFNLRYVKGGGDSVQLCVPSGWTRKGDGDVQHIMFTDDLGFVGSKKYGLSYTDHDGWLVKLNGT
ncbi:hypothetical protein EJ04DRAFT_610088 [Polyplosphaeria fusca]|uniref:Endonuclease/exonuclease/phosphatase domain-containing protein n=1 Tax=Polyplosphaeria fusca TaxID=682080 RepID=A0A9P4QUA1_9PLEO|nr:hypothetical protein EJ04DRAFT_610088 [Polyplosphaeria fusca]